jgi:transposase-like protein
MEELAKNLEGMYPSTLTNYIKNLVSQEIAAYMKEESFRQAEIQSMASKPTFVEMTQKIKEMSLSGHGVRFIQSYFYKEQGQDVSENKIISLHQQVSNDFRAWQSRTLDSIYAFIWVGAVPYTILENGEVVEKEFRYVIGVNRWGFKQLIGIYKGGKNGVGKLLLKDLKERGVREIAVYVASRKEEAVTLKASFPESYFLLSVVQQINRSTENVHYTETKKVQSDLKSMFKSSSYLEAQQKLLLLQKTWGNTYPELITNWKELLPSFMSFFRLPLEMQRLLYSSRMGYKIELKLNGVIRTLNEDLEEDEMLRILYYYQIEVTRRWGAQKIYNWKKLRLDLNEIGEKSMF